MAKIKVLKNEDDFEPEDFTRQVEIKSKDDVYNLIFKEDDVTWKTIIMDLCKSGKIDPWDIEVSTLAQEYLKIVSRLKETNFRLSGKIILAGALLLRLKSDRMGMKEFMQLTNPEEFSEDSDENSLFDVEGERRFSKAGLQPRIPGIRKRKVTVFELIDALKQALEVDQRREKRLRDYGADVIRPVQEIKQVDWFAKVKNLFETLRNYVAKTNKLTVNFTEIVPSETKEDKILTFISLLHLANEGKVDLRQEYPFGNIFVDVNEEELSKKLKGEEAQKPQEIIKEEDLGSKKLKSIKLTNRVRKKDKKADGKQKSKSVVKYKKKK
ncbi:MAG: segregation/condensation protein A [DPANN group archaeon]|nr:segregation/condensation protein A [DPANN group archaeon]